MAHPMTLPLAAAVAIAGTTLGLQLGRSAVAEIDPAHFSSPDHGRFFADLVPGGYDPSLPEPRQQDDAWASEAGATGRPDCYGCGTYVEAAVFWPEADYPDVAIGFDDEPAALPSPAKRDGRMLMPEEVERYAYFPVTREEAQEQAEAEASDRLSYAERADGSPASAPMKEPAPIGM